MYICSCKNTYINIPTTAFNNSLSFLETSIYTLLTVEETLPRKSPHWTNGEIPPTSTASFPLSHPSLSYDSQIPSSSHDCTPHPLALSMSPERARVHKNNPRYLRPEPSPQSPSCFENRKNTASQDKSANPSKHHQCRISSALFAYVPPLDFIRVQPPKQPALQPPFPPTNPNASEKREKKEKKARTVTWSLKSPLNFHPRHDSY